MSAQDQIVGSGSTYLPQVDEHRSKSDREHDPPRPSIGVETIEEVGSQSSGNDDTSSRLVLEHREAVRARRDSLVRVEAEEEDDSRLNDAVAHEDQEQPRAEPVALAAVTVELRDGHEDALVDEPVEDADADDGCDGPERVPEQQECVLEVAVNISLATVPQLRRE